MRKPSNPDLYRVKTNTVLTNPSSTTQQAFTQLVLEKAQDLKKTQK